MKKKAEQKAEKERMEKEEKARRELLFNQTSDKVKKAREEAAKAAALS